MASKEFFPTALLILIAFLAVLIVCVSGLDVFLSHYLLWKGAWPPWNQVEDEMLVEFSPT